MTNIILDQRAETIIESSRVFDCNIITMYKAWTDPEYLKNWWGPNGFTNTFTEYDLRPGGWWRFVMHGPEKGNYVNECQFIEVREPELLIWNHVSPPEFQIVARFIQVTSLRTEVNFRMVFETAEARNKLISFVPAKNEENFDRLQKVLEQIKQ